MARTTSGPGSRMPVWLKGIAGERELPRLLALMALFFLVV
jgi:hypothetical protein